MMTEPNAVPTILVIMGVSGAGKTTIGRALAARLSWAFQEGDALHPTANVERMRAGLPLEDADRAPWIEAVTAWIDRQRAAGEPGVITCSALKRAYRRKIAGGRPEVRLVHLRGGRDLIAARLAEREGHFMPPGLLQSQLDALEAPGQGEEVTAVDIDQPAEAVVEEIVQRLALGR